MLGGLGVEQLDGRKTLSLERLCQVCAGRVQVGGANPRGNRCRDRLLRKAHANRGQGARNVIGMAEHLVGLLGQVLRINAQSTHGRNSSLDMLISGGAGTQRWMITAAPKAARLARAKVQPGPRVVQL